MRPGGIDLDIVRASLARVCIRANAVLVDEPKIPATAEALLPDLVTTPLVLAALAAAIWWRWSAGRPASDHSVETSL